MENNQIFSIHFKARIKGWAMLGAKLKCKRKYKKEHTLFRLKFKYHQYGQRGESRPTTYGEPVPIIVG